MTELFLAFHLPVSNDVLLWEAGARAWSGIPWDIEDKLWRWILDFDQVNCMFLEPCGAVTAWARAIETDELKSTVLLEMVVNHSGILDEPPHVLKTGLPLNRFIPQEEGDRLQNSFIRRDLWITGKNCLQTSDGPDIP